MRILGVDPGLRICGYGVIDSCHSSLKLVEAGIVTTDSSQKIEQRLNKIQRSFKELILQTKPKVLVLEKLYSHYRHPTTACILGHARGVICSLCGEYNIELIEYSATRIKKAIVGRGHAGKLQIKGMIRRMFNIDTASFATDVTDALALAVAHTRIGKT
ncbi:MAG TPA: crossover junction endodeoxyribonuclease RuvC [Candidatus Omnitrophica bacterium]|nr:crossover junction endodeoxyribonuclease RuvC [Candidatus Omnitrophota bacterium]